MTLHLISTTAPDARASATGTGAVVVPFRSRAASARVRRLVVCAAPADIVQGPWSVAGPHKPTQRGSIPRPATNEQTARRATAATAVHAGTTPALRLVWGRWAGLLHRDTAPPRSG